MPAAIKVEYRRAAAGSILSSILIARIPSTEEMIPITASNTGSAIRCSGSPSPAIFEPTAAVAPMAMDAMMEFT